LIADYIEEMKNLGFEPGVNFVEINKKNSIDQINDCIHHSEEYEGIRKEGKKFITKNHSLDIRFNQFKKVINEILN
jgi:hypothetical protein